MSNLSPEEILHLGQLARLDLTEEEQARFSGQLSPVVQYVEQLSQVDTSSAGELRGVTGLTNVLAEDEGRSSEDLASVSRDELLAGAPLQEDGFYIVRAVLGDEVVSA